MTAEWILKCTQKARPRFMLDNVHDPVPLNGVGCKDFQLPTNFIFRRAMHFRIKLEPLESLVIHY